MMKRMKALDNFPVKNAESLAAEGVQCANPLKGFLHSHKPTFTAFRLAQGDLCKVTEGLLHKPIGFCTEKAGYCTKRLENTL